MEMKNMVMYLKKILKQYGTLLYEKHKDIFSKEFNDKKKNCLLNVQEQLSIKDLIQI